MLDVRARQKMSRVVDPVARLIARTGATPTMVTITGLTLSIAGSVLIAGGRLAVGAVILGVGAALDILDGVLARVTGTESTRGALLDSFTDRVGEVAMWTGLAFYLGGRAEAALVTLSIVAVCGSLLTPYLRAKAEALGIEGKGGLMGRAERLLVFGLGVGLEGVGLPTLEAAVWIVAVGAWVTVIQRFVRTWRRLPA
ncbi:MAG: CDP-alcohol phosphatidyltransferase family protein [Acidimicrobiia bacterium]|nr:CDP-alcohol phosphatidyltransferase family protein [Acidimicrobiia bacterium]